jgi:hypothetical protein
MTLDIDTRLNPNSADSRPYGRQNRSVAGRRPPTLRKALTDRLSGPGGLYSFGNLIGHQARPAADHSGAAQGASIQRRRRMIHEPSQTPTPRRPRPSSLRG